MSKEKSKVLKNKVWLDFTRLHYDENGVRWVNEDDALRLVDALKKKVEGLGKALEYYMDVENDYGNIDCVARNALEKHGLNKEPSE